MSWGSSNKTTSGQFAHDLNGKPIFVSDFVEFRCSKRDCRCRSGLRRNVHFGRVRCVGINQINGSKRNGKVELEIQECLGSGHHIFSTTASLDPPLVENEFVFTWNIHFVLEANVSTVNYSGDVIVLDYKYGDEKLSSMSTIPLGKEFIRRTLDVGHGDPLPLDHDFDETPLCRQAPLRGELEMEAYGRQFFLDLDEYVRSGGTIWSIPYLSFIDGRYPLFVFLYIQMMDF